MECVSRPKEFETDDILDRAGELFWAFGYQSTSIPELEAATGIGRGSLYNAFGDKEGLYLAALARYHVKYGAPPMAHLTDDDVGDGIRNMLEAVIERMGRSDVPNGCLHTSSCIENDGRSTRIASAVATNLDSLESHLQAAIERAIRLRQVPRGTNAERLARFFAAVTQSLGVIHRASSDVTRLHDIVDAAMDVWPAAPPKRGIRTRPASPRRPDSGRG
jgi:TetR/AcrR family transcriptional repressor of nem operon